ncbi:MAG TPA: response regulator [Planctomycetaceae bacterium]|nr:response regulator [Planctomycetaceae bacterium]
MVTETTRRRTACAAAIGAIAFVFAADLLTPLGIEISLFYLAGIWAVYFLHEANWLWITAAAITGLTILGYALSPPGPPHPWTLLANRLLALSAIWLTAALCYWIQQSAAEQRRLKDLLQSLVDERTAQLRASEERFELAVLGSTDGLWDWNILTGEVYYSPRMKELIGHADDDFPDVFASFESILHPDDHDWVLREIDAHLKYHKPYDVQYRLRSSSGQYRWFRARGQAIWDADGRPTRAAGSITDVTEEHLLRERFRRAVEASPAALMMVHEDGRILMANSRSQTLFGYAAAELIGQQIEMLVPERFRSGHPAHRRQYFQAPVQRAMGPQLDLYGVRKDGSEFPIKVSLSPVETDDGQAVMCGVLDITDQVKSLEAMRQAKESAESASRAKSSFMANMSHEIRTPMNGIIGMAQLLSQTELRSHQRDYLATITESAHVLLRLLNDILDFSKIEAGRLELECVEFRISECVARASQMLMLRAAEKGLELACRVAPEVPDHLCGDPGRIQQVLVNLLGNAVKFTEAGEVFMNLEAEEITSGTVRLHVSVSDTGIGIPHDKQAQMFRPFVQAESSTTRRFGGTGLGLAISRQLVEMMHGRMWLESEVDRGTTIHFTAEFGIAADQHLPRPAELDSLQNIPVLVVDDNSTNLRILSEMLQRWRMQPVLADSASAARQALRQAEESTHPVRLILLDHHMPDEDGFEFATSVQRLLESRKCPMIMISSGVAPVEGDVFQKYGICRFMTKPVIASELLNEILRQFGRGEVGTTLKPASMEGKSTAVQPRRVLLVEDNEINRRVAMGLLHSRGHQVVFAENGAEAVATLNEQDFDVVLMDMQMPVMDGYEATAVIRKREEQTGGHIPIVAMTAEALMGDRERCLAAGMDDYVAKPIVPGEMYRAVERFPALCLPTLVPPPGASPTPTVPAAAASRSPIPRSSPPANGGSPPPAVDWDVAREHLGSDPQVLQEFVGLLKSQSPTLLAEIRRAIEAGDFKLLRRSAHTLKGSASYFGAEPLVTAALALEAQGRNETLDGATEKLATLQAELDRVLEALDGGPAEVRV